MGRSRIDADLMDELDAVAADVGCDLLDVEFKGGTMRLIIDRTEGVTLADCETVSRQVSPILDVADFGAGKYLLEVSSPGLDRKLYGLEDYDRFSGRTVRVTWQEPEMPHRKTVVGTLDSFYREPRPTATVVDSTTGERYSILLKNIELARLEPDFGS